MLQPLLCEMPDDDAGCYAYIHGMFGAKLRNFYSSVARIDHTLLNTFHFIA